MSAQSLLSLVRYRVSLALAFACLGLSAGRASGEFISMSASASVQFDGGFGGAINNFGPFILPFDPNPPVSIFSTIYGPSPDESNLAVGGSKYLTPNLAALILANGSFLSQFAPVPPLGPAVGTADFSASWIFP
jgi:hypothetical protein